MWKNKEEHPAAAIRNGVFDLVLTGSDA